MNPSAPVRIAVKGRSGNVGLSVFTAALIAAMPMCPLCAMALMSALGVGSIIGSAWLQPLAVALLLLSVGALFVRAPLAYLRAALRRACGGNRDLPL